MIGVHTQEEQIALIQKVDQNDTGNGQLIRPPSEGKPKTFAAGASQ